MRWLTLLFALLMAPPATGETAGIFNLDSLFVVSVGGPTAVERLSTVKTFYASGQVSLNGTPGTFVSYVTIPNQLYLKVDLGGFSVVQAYDGLTAWQQDMNGHVSELHGYERTSLESQVYLQTYSYLFKDRLPGSVAYNGIVERNGTRYHEVLIMPLDADTVYSYFDIATGYQDIAVIHMDNLEAITNTSDYRVIDGVLVGCQSRSETTGVPIYTEFTLDSMAFNLPIDPSIYALGVGKPDFRFPPNADSVVIPIEYRDGHIFVEVTINGIRKLRLMLDSGASSNLFSRTAVDSLDLPVVGQVAGKGIGGYSQVNLVKSDSIEVGGLTLFRQVAGVTDLSSLQGILNFDGLLGQDFLSRFPVLVDYHDQRIVVYNQDKFNPPQGGTDVPFKLTMQVPTITAELDGLPGEYLVDLGSGFGLIVHKHWSDLNHLEERLDDIQDYKVAIGGLGSDLQGKSGYAASFEFGNIRINALRVVLPEAGDGLAGSKELAGNIGNLVLDQFRLLFDYLNSRIIFYPAEESNE